MSDEIADRLFLIVAAGVMLCFAIGIAFEGWADVERARVKAHPCPCQTAKK